MNAPPNDGLEWGTLAQWVGPWIGAAVAIVLALWGKFSRQDEQALSDIKDDIAELRADDGRLFERVDKVEADIAAVKADVKHLPTREEVHRIDIKVTEIGSAIRNVLDKVETVINQNERMQDRLIEREEREARR